MTASHYVADYFYLLKTDHWITTHSCPNSWFQIELTKGYAILTGFRFRKIEDYETLHYQIIATDYKNKEERLWKKLYDIENEKETYVVRKFSELSPRVKFVRLVQTKKNPKSSKCLIFNSSFFGYYFDGPIPEN